MGTRLIALLAVALLMVFAPTAQAQSDTGTVTVVHGAPDTPVDVHVNGDATLEGFEPGTVTDPLQLPAGSYDVEIYPAGWTRDRRGSPPATRPRRPRSTCWPTATPCSPT